MARKPPANWSLQPAEEALLMLLRRALFSAELKSGELSKPIRWEMVFDEARRQAVLPLAVDAAVSLPEALRPPESVRASAVNDAILQVTNNERLMMVQDELIQILNRSGIPYAILKGTSAAARYPKPELRVQGDIDVLVNEGDLDPAIGALSKSGYQLMPSDASYDVKLYKDNIRVEVHRAVSDIPLGEAGDFIRTALTGTLASGKPVSIEDHSFIILADKHQALSLLLHMRFHLLGSGLGLRQLCDYALFVHRVNKQTWEEEITPILRQSGLWRFAAILAKTCHLYLGLPLADCPWCMDADEAACAKVIADFFSSGNFGSKDPGRIPSAVLSAGREKPNTNRYNPMNLIRNLNANARKNFPICVMFPVLLPAMWVYLPIRYYIRMKTGKRRYQPVGDILNSAHEREALFKEFGLFQPEEELRGKN